MANPLRREFSERVRVVLLSPHATSGAEEGSMKTLNRLIAVLSGLVATLVFASAIAIAQPASQGAP